MMWATPSDVRLAEVRDRGDMAVTFLLATSLAGFPAAWFLPPPVVSSIVACALVIVVVLVAQEIRYNFAEPMPGPRRWLIYSLAVLTAVFAVPTSFLFAYFGSAPDACRPFPASGGRPSICFTTTHAESMARLTWIIVMLIMALLFVMGLMLSGRSRLALRAAFAQVAAACTIAFDASHAVAVMVGQNSA
jgi:beta-lactamase regulating signal transducer with metallopeptidase domain